MINWMTGGSLSKNCSTRTGRKRIALSLSPNSFNLGVERTAMLTRVFVQLITSACFVATWLNIQSTMGQDPRRELTSYLSANQAYWDSVRQFDVLVRTDVMRPPAISSGYVETSF